METTMLRKLALGLAAAASLGLAAFAPTAASAYSDGPHFRGHHNGFGMHRGWHGWRGAQARGGCIQQRLVPTPWGPRYRTVNVCRY
jgi:Spy/CpxP family protein refolding chaperone